MSLINRAKQLVLAGRVRKYQTVFNTPEGNEVLRDLAKFCRATDTCTQVSPVSRTVDPYATMQAAGRQEVFHRIMWHLGLDEKDILKITLKELSDD